MRSLILVGHGSHFNAQTAAGVQQCADELRATGQFGEVLMAFWKEEPSLRQVLKTVQFTDVTVVPMLLCEGHLSQTVVPRELGLGHQGPVPVQGVTRVISGLSVHYTRPYGTHPAMAQVIAQCAQEALEHEALDGEAAAAARGKPHLYLVGREHPGGTLRALLTEHAATLQRSGAFGSVKAAVVLDSALEELPLPEGMPQMVPQRAASSEQEVIQEVAIVPFALSHEAAEQLAQQIDADLRAKWPGVKLIYAQAVGTHLGAAQVALQLAQQASTPLGGDVERTYHERWQALSALCTPERPLRLGEVLVRQVGKLIEVRHALDEARSNDSLRTVVTLPGLREQIRHDDSGQFRPLSTLRTLPRGWRAVFLRRELPQAVQTLYPGVIEESYAHHFHALRATPWAATARRQTGSLANVQRATPQQLERVAHKLCGACLKTRLWAGETLHQTCFSGVPGAFPCAEACSLLIAQVSAAVAETG